MLEQKLKPAQIIAEKCFQKFKGRTNKQESFIFFFYQFVKSNDFRLTRISLQLMTSIYFRKCHFIFILFHSHNYNLLALLLVVGKKGIGVIFCVFNTRFLFLEEKFSVILAYALCRHEFNTKFCIFIECCNHQRLFHQPMQFVVLFFVKTFGLVIYFRK